jgi:hypothetical protein
MRRMIAKSNERQQTAGSDGNDLSWHVAILNELSGRLVY